MDEIISAHAETVEGLKEQIAQFKADAEQLPKVKEELDKAKAAAKDGGEYEKLKSEFDKYKADVAAEKTLAAKKTALQKVAKDAGLTDAGIAKALKYSDFGKIELDDKGEAKNASDLMKGLKEEWAEYIGSTETKGADTPKPPASSRRTTTVCPMLTTTRPLTRPTRKEVKKCLTNFCLSKTLLVRLFPV